MTPSVRNVWSTVVATCATYCVVEISLLAWLLYADASDRQEGFMLTLASWHGAALSVATLFLLGAKSSSWEAMRGIWVVTAINVVVGLLAFALATMGEHPWTLVALYPFAPLAFIASLRPFGLRVEQREGGVDGATSLNRWTWTLGTMLAATTWLAGWLSVVAALWAWHLRELQGHPGRWLAGVEQIIYLGALAIGLMQMAVQLCVARWAMAGRCLAIVGSIAVVVAIFGDQPWRPWGALLGAAGLTAVVAWEPFAWHGWRVTWDTPWWDRSPSEPNVVQSDR